MPRKYKYAKQLQQRSQTVARNKEAGDGAPSEKLRERLLKNPMWQEFKPEESGMEVRHIQWLDDVEENRVCLYPTDDLLKSLLGASGGNFMAVFLLIIRLTDDAAHVRRRDVLHELQQLRQINNLTASRALTHALLQLRAAGLVQYDNCNIYINPAHAYRGDRGKSARTLFWSKKN